MLASHGTVTSKRRWQRRLAAFYALAAGAALPRSYLGKGKTPTKPTKSYLQVAAQHQPQREQRHLGAVPCLLPVPCQHAQ